MAAGIGIDSHRFEAGRRLVLGGVEIPYEMGLAGHSDADVLTHAVIDALLGAAGQGDIGQHFPDTDPRWRDADSLDLLRDVMALLDRLTLRVAQVDATIMMERPRIGAYRASMREALSTAMRLPVKCVNVKATTGEGVGFVGRGEGVAALAVATIADAGSPDSGTD